MNDKVKYFLYFDDLKKMEIDKITFNWYLKKAGVDYNDEKISCLAYRSKSSKKIIILTKTKS